VVAHVDEGDHEADSGWGVDGVRIREETSQVAWRSSAGRRVGWRAARAVTAARRRRVSAAIDGVWREARASSEKKSVAVLTSGEVLEGSMARYDKSGDSDSVDGMLNVHESPRGDRRISALRSQVDSRFVRDHNDVVAFLDERTLKNSLVQLRSEKKRRIRVITDEQTPATMKQLHVRGYWHDALVFGAHRAQMTDKKIGASTSSSPYRRKSYLPANEAF